MSAAGRGGCGAFVPPAHVLAHAYHLLILTDRDAEGPGLVIAGHNTGQRAAGAIQEGSVEFRSAGTLSVRYERQVTRPGLVVGV